MRKEPLESGVPEDAKCRYLIAEYIKSRHESSVITDFLFSNSLAAMLCNVLGPNVYLVCLPQIGHS